MGKYKKHQRVFNNIAISYSITQIYNYNFLKTES